MTIHDNFAQRVYRFAYIMILVEGFDELFGRLMVVGLGEEPLDGRALLRLKAEEKERSMNTSM